MLSMLEPIEKVVELLQHLVDSDQVPPESQVVETGVKYPVKRHRRKTPQEMVRRHKTHYAYIKKSFMISLD